MPPVISSEAASTRVFEYSNDYRVLDVGAANRKLVTKLICVQGCLFVKLLRLTETYLKIQENMQ